MFNPPHGTTPKTMRTKTPKQIDDQYSRIGWGLFFRTGLPIPVPEEEQTSERYKQYEANEKRVEAIAERYLDNMAKYFGLYDNCTMEQWQEVYNTPVPASIYARQV